MTYDECVQVIEKAEQEGATELDLSGERLKKLPPEIGRLTQLTEFYACLNCWLGQTRVFVATGG